MKIVLFDRDGTLIVDPEDLRVTTEEKIVLFPDTISSLQKLAENGYSVVMITNQAGIAEGMLDANEFERLNSIVTEKLEESGITIFKTYMCPHVPEDNCDCRKPKPKMLNEAIKEYGLDPAKTFMIGDRESDIKAGINAGTHTILVKTANEPVEAPDAEFTAKNLTEVVDYILKQDEAAKA